MARSFLTGINLNKNELTNAAIQPLDGPPSFPVTGQIYFDTTLVTLRQWTGSAWIDYLNSADGSNYIESVDANFTVTDQTLSLADSVTIDTSLTIGGTPITGASPTDGTLTVKNAGNEPAFIADGYTNQVSFYSQDGNLKAHTEASSGAGAFRIVTTDDLALRSTNGDIILYPGEENGSTGKAFVGWGNAAAGRAGGVQGLENEITTAGNTQDLTNKTIADATVYGRTSFKDNTSEDPEYLSIERAYTGTARFVAPDDISIRSTGGDIILYPGSDDGGTGKAYIGWGDDNWGAYPEREIATKGYVDGVAQGLSVLGSVRTATGEDIDLTQIVSEISGVNVVIGDRVLVKNQDTATENGIYVVIDDAGLFLQLSTNLEDTDLKVGSYTLVTNGDYAATGWIVTAYTTGSSTWTQFSAANEYTAGTAIDITTNAISVKYGSGLTVGMDGNLAVDATAVPYKYSENNPELIPSSGQVYWDVHHELNTEDFTVSVRELSSGALVEVDVYSDGANNIAILFNTSETVAIDTYRVTVIG